MARVRFGMLIVNLFVVGFVEVSGTVPRIRLSTH